ncbi:MAG: hypothetical protein Fues2KO_02310 [Fuerstiella sp.]
MYQHVHVIGDAADFELAAFVRAHDAADVLVQPLLKRFMNLRLAVFGRENDVVGKVCGLAPAAMRWRRCAAEMAVNCLERLLLWNLLTDQDSILQGMQTDPVPAERFPGLKVSDRQSPGPWDTFRVVFLTRGLTRAGFRC